MSSLDGVARTGAKSMGTWWWVLTLPFGVTTWAAFLYAGHQTKRRDLLRAGGIYAGTLVAAFVLTGVGNKGAVASVGGAVLFFTWVAGMVHAGMVRRRVNSQLSLVDASALTRAQHELDRRAYGRQLLVTNPSLARQLGVGRPDIAGADSFGLVDVNHAGDRALLTLPGLTDEHVQKILDYRKQGGSFVSAGDMAMYLDLPGAAIGPLTDATVFDLGTL